MSRREFRKRAFHSLIAALALCVLIVWASVWTDLREYEENSETNVMEAFCSELALEAEQGSCEELLKASGYSSRTADASVSGAHLAQLAAGKELSFEPLFEESAGEGGESVQSRVPGAYTVLADGERIAGVRVSSTGSYGLLKLDRIGVTSVRGLKSFDIAVVSPERYSVWKTPILKLPPAKTGYIYRDFTDLAQNTADVRIPDFYVYTVDGLFGAPVIYRTGAEDEEAYPVTVKDGIYFVNNHASMEPEEGFDAMAKSMAQDIARVYAGELKWDNVKGSVLSSAPVFARLEAAEGSINARQTAMDFSEASLGEIYIWHENLVSARISFQAVLKAPDGDVIKDFDWILYLTRSDVNDDWKLCELVDLMPAQP